MFIHRLFFARRLISAALLLGLLMPLASRAQAASGAHAITVTDYNGDKVSLQQPARRIIALAPHIVENLYSAGAGQYLVGAVDYCDYPPQAKAITRVGSISSHSIEAILAQQPDLVIAWNSGYGGKIIGKLRALGIPVYASNPLQLEDVARSIRDYGKLANTTAVAEKAAQTFLARLQGLRDQYTDHQRLTVLYEVWNSPLQTLNGEHIISDVIALCGGQNVFADAPVIAPKISLESVLSRNPDVIVASGMGEERPEWLDDWRKWPSLKAVQNNHLFFIPPDIIQRHTARILQGVNEMCVHLENARTPLSE
ncbi:cobalamin-binding protein [Teredinibacter turnerae]|uniref:Fe3+-hydroxamate ABC transporter periplasmic binding protein n=1 Tax=Teredinibacter turnerae (strain ATCC 39867 / T7901) TaxID=377629 RepID=C5BS16_TERTT|nr:cobalamin-binding protein [Teredinibacter turnerae]ACR14465.1 Fe3+-hydroxamate ABC transporter periplasmic binding protein [Teredinibacter turnerae T7901]